MFSSTMLVLVIWYKPPANKDQLFSSTVLVSCGTIHLAYQHVVISSNMPVWLFKYNAYGD